MDVVPRSSWVFGVILLTACQSTLVTSTSAPALDCTIPVELISDGGPGKDGIPALTNPALVDPGHRGAAYLFDDDRVIGLVVSGQAIAVPLNIGWWHEIVNLDIGTNRLAVTHCPLTGSSIVFDRGAAANATFGVSGLLYMNNLIMYERVGESSLWPQMARGARCGAAANQNLTSFPSVEMTWAGWRALQPNTKVVSSETGHFRDYRAYPYGSYDQPTNGSLLFPMPSVDSRRPPKERVLGIPRDSAGGIALPFGELEERGALAAVHVTLSDTRHVVFWDGVSQLAAAYLASTGTAALSFRVADGQIVDAETGSVWRVDVGSGPASSGWASALRRRLSGRRQSAARLIHRPSWPAAGPSRRWPPWPDGYRSRRSARRRMSSTARAARRSHSSRMVRFEPTRCTSRAPLAWLGASMYGCRSRFTTSGTPMRAGPESGSGSVIPGGRCASAQRCSECAVFP